MQIGRLLALVLNVDVFVDHAPFERAWPVEREHGDNIADIVGPHADEKIAYAAAFELENTLGFAAAQERVGFRVVLREIVRIDLLAGRLLDERDGIGENR